jgi:hypothetical protein
VRHRIRPHVTYANVMATIAVFLVLSGGTAVALNGANTVFSDDIVNGEVKADDIGSNAVRSGKIADGGVQGVDILDGAVDSPDILDGAVSNNDVRKNAINAGKVQDESLTGSDVLNDSLTGTDVAESSLGQVPSAASADSLNGRSAAELEGARAYAIVRGGNCDPNSGFCPIVHGKRVAYAFHAAPGKYCVGVSGIPATDPNSLALVSSTFPQPREWGYWRWAVYGNNEACVGSEYEIYMIYGDSGFTDLDFTIVIP